MPVRVNTTLRSLRNGGCVLGAETALFHPAVPLLYANAGLDFIWIDLEHTLASLERVGVLIQHARLAGITPLVRVPELRPGLIRPLLDNGAQGIILPLVESPEAAAELVSWCHFHPSGRRGVGSPQLANDFAPISLAEHVAHSSDEVVVAIQIETRRGVEQAEEILRVDGLDVVCVGLNDLSISYGVPGQIDNPLVIEAAEHVLALTKPHGVAGGVAGFYGYPHEDPPLAIWHRRGATFFQLFGDLALLDEATRAIAAAARRELDDARLIRDGR